MIQTDKASCSLPRTVCKQLLVNLHLVLLGDHIIVRLKDLLACDSVVEKLRRKNFIGSTIDNRSNLIGAARSPDNFAGGIENFQRDESPAKRNPGRETVSGEIFNVYGRLQRIICPAQRCNCYSCRLVPGQAVTGAQRSQQPEHAFSVHVVGRAYAQNVGELLEHHHAKLIDTNQGVARILLAHAQSNFLIRSSIVSIGIGIVFNIRYPKYEWPIEKLRWHVTILTGARSLQVERLAFILVDAVEPLRISSLLVKFFWLTTGVANRLAFPVKNRKDDRVTAATQGGRLDLLPVTRRYVQSLLHRQGSHLIVRTVNDVGRVKFEFPGETLWPSESILSNSMTARARDAVASERAILPIELIGQRIDHAVFERLILIQSELSLAHHAVTPVAGIVKESCL